jgi:hypothetical protein
LMFLSKRQNRIRVVCVGDTNNCISVPNISEEAQEIIGYKCDSFMPSSLQTCEVKNIVVEWFQCEPGSGSSFLPADPDLGSQTKADPCGSGTGSDFASHKKVKFFNEKYTLCR